ncbi:MAG TPA: substrate-binding domain-containing protein [Syntrophales bacterium]|nr:substrate-binding domain-containing protein [Syntrophales bacterium]
MNVHCRGLFLFPLYLVLAAFLFCTGVRDAGAGETIRINGSGAPLEMMNPFIEAYSKTKRDVSFEIVKPLGSSGAIKALLAGAIDIAVISRPLRPEEIARGGMSRPFGETPLAVVTHRDVRLKSISTRELEDIYAGRTKNWPGGETVRVILRPREDTDTKILKSLSPGMAAAVVTAHQRQGMMVALTDPESNEAVSRTPGGIGTAALAGVLVSGLPLNVVALNGVRPSRKTLADGSYPFAREILFATTGKLPAAASQFLEFVYSKRGRALAGKYGVLVTGSGK